MHFIRDDLDAEDWAEDWSAVGIAELEEYLARWAAFEAFMAGRQ